MLLVVFHLHHQSLGRGPAEEAGVGGSVVEAAKEVSLECKYSIRYKDELCTNFGLQALVEHDRVAVHVRTYVLTYVV